MRTGIIAMAVLAMVAAACDSATDPTVAPTPATSDNSPTSATDAPSPTGSADARGLAFSDVTDAVGLTFTYATPFSLENYTSLMDTAKMRGGATVGDFNNDGWGDLFILGGGLEADALFLNRRDGTFEEIGEEAGVVGPFHLGSSATAGDFDGDGWATGHSTRWLRRPGSTTR